MQVYDQIQVNVMTSALALFSISAYLQIKIKKLL